MVSIKLKFRPSTVKSKEGYLYYQVIYQRTVRQLATRYRVMSEEWDASTHSLCSEVASPHRAEYLSDIRLNIRWDMERFQRIVHKAEESGHPFTADDILTTFQQQMEKMTIFNYMELQIIKLMRHKQYRTAETYRSTLNSLRRFRNEEDLTFEALNTEFLEDYAYYLKDNRLSPNTRSFYMKRLRAVYSKAVEEGWTDERHPFRKVFTSTEKTIKRAIPLRAIRRLKDLDLSQSPTRCFARDMFLFSFYTRGMSFVDIAYLQKENLKNGVLSYRRKKTGQLLTMHWENCMDEIAGRYAAPPTSPYLLSIIKELGGDNRKQYINALTLINRKLKEIGQSIGLTRPLTLYVARHSWASIAHNEGIPLSVISEGMGHESEKTTRIYLASLEAEVIDKANRKILRKL
ncbi:MAG: site-specific integrase [Bacteroides sp.]|nr:site-specific integrase [Bacteroides sp.]